LIAVSAFTMKHPPVQFTDYEALRMLEEFIAGNGYPSGQEGTYQPARPAEAHSAAK
jgi:hypothetical protein